MDSKILQSERDSNPTTAVNSIFNMTKTKINHNKLEIFTERERGYATESGVLRIK